MRSHNNVLPFEKGDALLGDALLGDKGGFAFAVAIVFYCCLASATPRFSSSRLTCLLFRRILTLQPVIQQRQPGFVLTPPRLDQQSFCFQPRHRLLRRSA